MLNPSPLIIARVMAGTAIMLNPHDHEEFVKFLAELLISKAGRVLQDAPQVVPGRYCEQCLDRGCPYYVGGSPTKRMVTMGEGAFTDDLNMFFTNIPKVCAATSRLVLGLVEDTKGGLPQ